MSFTEEEKRVWHAAKQAGIKYDIFNLKNLREELEWRDELKTKGNSEEGVELSFSSTCAHCGHSLGGTSSSDFPLCNACDG